MLDKVLACDVAVVGGGITGTLIGYYLTKAGVNTLVVDRDEMGLGSTAGSTGLLQYEIDTSLVELIARLGELTAVQAYRRCLLAIDELQALAGELNQPCGFARRPTLCLASSPADATKLKREYECRRYFGFDMKWLGQEQLQEFCGINAPGATYSQGDGELDPYRFTHSLLQTGCRQGLRLFRGTPIVGINESDLQISLSTPTGQILAETAIFCTGYAAHEFLPGGPGKLTTTYAVASQPLAAPPSQWPDKCLIWETARPYFYGRQTEDGRALIGGGDTSGAYDHRDDGLLNKKADVLKRRLNQLFPAVALEPEFVWAGTFAETRDGLPYIGLLPGRKRVYFALGYGGNGITFGVIAARLLTDLFLQRPNDDVAVFRFGR